MLPPVIIKTMAGMISRARRAGSVASLIGPQPLPPPNNRWAATALWPADHGACLIMTFALGRRRRRRSCLSCWPRSHAAIIVGCRRSGLSAGWARRRHSSGGFVWRERAKKSSGEHLEPMSQQRPPRQQRERVADRAGEHRRPGISSPIAIISPEPLLCSCRPMAEELEGCARKGAQTVSRALMRQLVAA
jgi:hypothetical protein